jgi:hypothetical protein
MKFSMRYFDLHQRRMPATSQLFLQKHITQVRAETKYLFLLVAPNGCLDVRGGTSHHVRQGIVRRLFIYASQSASLKPNQPKPYFLFAYGKFFPLRHFT